MSTADDTQAQEAPAQPVDPVAAKEKFARRAIAGGMSRSMAAKITGLSLEEVDRIAGEVA